MTEMNTQALPEFLFKRFQTERVKVYEIDGEIRLMPMAMEENADCTVGLRGLFANCPEMSVDKFLERKRADKELDR